MNTPDLLLIHQYRKTNLNELSSLAFNIRETVLIGDVKGVYMCEILLKTFRVALAHQSIVLMILAILVQNCRHSSEPTGSNRDDEATGVLVGVVRDSLGPICGAIVRIQTTVKHTKSNHLGKFKLTELIQDEPLTLTAWAPGYYIGGGESFIPDSNNIEIRLVPHAKEDNSEYEWLSAYARAGKDGNCENCHAESGDPNSALPFDEWRRDVHANSTQNPRFLTMYSGTDVYGNQSPSTRFGYSRDYGSFPLPPNPNEPYFGPGYKLDFPATSGNCAACHAPVAAVNMPYGIDPTEVYGVAAEGIACDFCHKVWDVRLNASTGLPYPNMPGVLSFYFRRPPEGHQFFAGPFDDVAPGEDVYTPIQAQSQYCAPCHFATFWDIEIYNSFGEWLASPYSIPHSGKTCQDCHMPPGLTDHFVRFSKGGNKRNPATIFSHRMLGAMDQGLLQNAVTMTATAWKQGGDIVVEVSITNDKTGHHVPTDSPLRHIILLLRVTDEVGHPLEQTGGPTLPDWCGVGDHKFGYYARLPGKAYAKILEEVWTGVSPTGAYWNMTRIVSDNRISAMGSDKSHYTFMAPPKGAVTVDIQLIFRRAFIELMDWKSWDVPDIVMAQHKLFLGERK